MTQFAKETLPISLEEEMRRSYLDYAMSVIVGRALPDARDGLKPVHRRVLYAMNEMGNTYNAKYRKSAQAVGETMGKYHPHGDSAIYDTIVRMAQPFSLRHMLIDGQGNFGSIDGDNAAAMRYTEIRLDKIAHELLADIDKDTVDFGPNYDGSHKEPHVLPTRLPNLLVNGSAGIAVGMATNIPPHNLNEVVDACLHLLQTPQATIDELMEDGYEAVFVGSGAGLPRFLNIPGENLLGVYSANEFLTRVNLMKGYKFPEAPTPVKVGRRVAVVGAGNVAMDAARTAKRLGAEEVYIVYRRSEEEAPARLEELHHAKEEGIIFRFLNNPAAILGDENGWVKGMEVVKQQLGEPDASGRRRPEPIEGSNYVMDVETVIIAIGQSPNPLIRQTTPGLDCQKWGGIIVNEETMESSKENVYAGGDTVTGAATVILAMGAGKRAAAAIDEKLSAK